MALPDNTPKANTCPSLSQGVTGCLGNDTIFSCEVESVGMKTGLQSSVSCWGADAFCCLVFIALKIGTIGRGNGTGLGNERMGKVGKVIKKPFMLNLEKKEGMLLP
jgi:hypothetical protein